MELSFSFFLCLQLGAASTVVLPMLSLGSSGEGGIVNPHTSFWATDRGSTPVESLFSYWCPSLGFSPSLPLPEAAVLSPHLLSRAQRCWWLKANAYNCLFLKPRHPRTWVIVFPVQWLNVLVFWHVEGQWKSGCRNFQVSLKWRWQRDQRSRYVFHLITHTGVYLILPTRNGD